MSVDDEEFDREDAAPSPDDDAAMDDGDDEPDEFAGAVPGGDHPNANSTREAIWHAPRGPLTRMAALFILIGLGLSLIALTVLAIVVAASS